RGRTPVPVPHPTTRGSLLLAGAVLLFALVLVTVLAEDAVISYGTLFPLGVIALSFVPLAGHTGQISLCQLSIAGIGAVVWGHLGAHGELWALPVAVLVAAAVGALIALPALRLSGIYLALGTAAFAVVLDRWIFTLPAFEVLGVRIALFDQGSVAVTGPDLFGLHLTSPAQLLVLSAACLALASLGVAALRRGRFGRRLIALRDSEAAYATLGGRLLATKTAVFALSAGIAGLGGALYGMQLQTVTAEQFNLVAGLPLFLIAVIGGLGAVGTGLFTGIAFVAPAQLLHGAGPWAHDVTSLLVALAGMGLAQSPSGVLARLRAQWRPLGRNRPLLSALLAVLGGCWLLAVLDVANGRLLLTVGVVTALLLRSRATARRQPPTDIPPEWWGLRRPWRPDDGEVLNRATTAAS
ncbi:branched-chain amino acid ABC transporter permease, partial [Streptomyces sp. ID05-04B]